MSEFEYLTGLLTIVLGLAIARAMSGIANFLVLSTRTLQSWTFFLFCLALAALQVDWWRVLWVTLGSSELMAEAVYLWITATVMLYLASYVLVPHLGADDNENVAPKEEVRPAFFACMAIHFCAFPLYQTMTGQIAAMEFGPLVMIFLCILGIFLRNAKVQFGFSLAWLLLAFGSIGLSFGTRFV